MISLSTWDRQVGQGRALWLTMGGYDKDMPLGPRGSTGCWLVCLVDS